MITRLVLNSSNHTGVNPVWHHWETPFSKYRSRADSITAFSWIFCPWSICYILSEYLISIYICSFSFSCHVLLWKAFLCRLDPLFQKVSLRFVKESRCLMEMRAYFSKRCSEGLGTQRLSLVWWWSGGVLVKLGGRDLGKYEILSLLVLSSLEKEEKSWCLCSSDLPLCKTARISEQSWQRRKKDSWQAYNPISFSLSHEFSYSSWIACPLSIIPRDSRIQLPFLKPEMRH